MKKSTLALLLVIVLVLSFSMAGCSSGGQQPTGGETSANAEATQTTADTATEKPEVSMLKISSGATGGGYQVFATAWGQAIEKEIPGIKVQVESSGGAISNFVACAADKFTLGIAQNAVSYEGENGLVWANGTKYPNVRSLFPVYPSISHFFATQKSGIKTLYDAEGKILCLGPAGGGIDVLGRDMLKILGINPRQVVNMNFSDAISAMKDGTVDVIGVGTGHPFSALVELEQTTPVMHIGLSREDTQKILDAFPYYPVVKLESDLYKYMDHDLENITMYSYTVCNADLPDEVAYQITKAAFENKDAIVTAMKAAEDIDIANLKYVGGKLHPGAYKYYQEIGVEISKELIPN